MIQQNQIPTAQGNPDNRGATLLKIFTITILSLWMGRVAAFEMAVTVDDLPLFRRGVDTKKGMEIVKTFVSVLKKHHVPPTYGFTIGQTVKKDPSSAQVLKYWVENGNLLANHTLTHPNLADVSADEYISEIEMDESIIKEYMQGKNFHFFRFPNQGEGNTSEKYNKVRNYLKEHGYQIAHVSINFFDYEWTDPFFAVRPEKIRPQLNILEKLLWTRQ